MSHAAFRSAIAGLAQAELDGEDIGPQVASLATQAGLDASAITHEIAEMQDLMR